MNLATWFGQRREQDRFRRHALVLSALALAPPRGGYDIWRLTGLRVAQVYATLGELERSGIVTATWEEPDGTSRPRRRLYQITKATP